MSDIEIIPTNTCPSTFAELSEQSNAYATYASWMQLDVGDGVFVPAISWPYGEGQWEDFEHMATKGEHLPCADTMSYEAHLMVEDPLHVGELLARVGCRRIIAHIETCADVSAAREACSIWKAAGAAEVGFALLLDTPLSVLDPIITLCDVVQIMSIATLGAQGAPYDARALERVAILHARYPYTVIAVDGGVSAVNIADLARAGSRHFGVGSAIAKADNPLATYHDLGERAASAVI